MAQVDINGLKFKQTRKKKYDVYVCMPAAGTKVTNRLEGAHYVTDQNKPFIISGTVGETWTIDAAKLAKTYTFADGSEITPEALKSRVKGGIIDWMRLTTRQTGMDINFAAHLPLSIKNFPVQTSWGDTLYANRDGVGHGKGDFLVCASINGQPNLNDVWVVNGEIFPTTYDMRAFPGLGTGVASETPVPKSIMVRGADGRKWSPDQQKRLSKVNHIINGLRQRGDKVGKLLDAGEETCSFSVNNGRYSVILYINVGDPQEGSDSISLMYRNNETWDEAATWFIDDYGMEESINKLHALVNGSSNLDGMISKISEHMPGAIQDDYAFEGYRMQGGISDMDKPSYFRQLLKTYNYVKDKLQLVETQNGLLTQTNEEPVHWRIDFNTRLCEKAMPFIDIFPDHLTVCVQTPEDDHWEETFPTGADGCKRGFQYIANIIKMINSGNY